VKTFSWFYSSSDVTKQACVFSQLAKDAGNFVAMTEDEKKRLKELLKEVDDMTNEDEVGTCSF